MVEDADAPGDAAPVERAARLVTLDFIRGIAVLGIVFSNIVDFAHPSLAYFWPPALPQPHWPSDDIAWVLQYLLIDGKMRGLFSLLFGAGMVLFIERARLRGQDTPLQARRLLLLGLFGLAHFLFLFTGDILTIYAIAGLLVLATVDWDARRLLILGTIAYFGGAFYFAASHGVAVAIEQSPAMQHDMAPLWQGLEDSWQAQLARADAERAVYGQGSYADVIGHAMGKFGSSMSNNVIFALFEAAPLMLVGMGLYKVGLFSGESGYGAARLGWALLIIGVVLTLPLALWALVEGFPPQLTKFVFQGIGVVPRLPFTVGMAILLALAAPRWTRGWLGSRLAAAGRMAFTNYVGTSLVMVLLFQGWALGLYGQFHRVELFAVVVAVWAFMLVWSAAWLRNFRYGPLEWLWRCLTYGRRFPIRIEKRLATATHSH